MDLALLIIFTTCQISVFINGFWVITPKPQFYPPCSIYRHGGHDGWSAGSSDITFKGNPLRMIQAKFGLNWPSGLRGEDFWKSLQTDDGHQVMAIAHTGELKRGMETTGPIGTKLCLVLWWHPFKIVSGNPDIQPTWPLAKNRKGGWNFNFFPLKLLGQLD